MLLSGKLGFIRPSWRFDCLHNPRKYKLEKFGKVQKPGVGCLKKFFNELQYTINYHESEFFKNVIAVLPVSLSNKLRSVHRKQQSDSKISVSNRTNNGKLLFVWNLQNIKDLDDEYLVKTIEHTQGFKYHEDISFAINFISSEECSEIGRYTRYCFFVGLEDKEVAKKFNLTLSKVKAIRYLFYDFTYAPKDKIGLWAYLRQLKELGDIDENDFAFCRRIFYMGELGLRAHVDYHSLTSAEKTDIDKYLGESFVVNTLDLDFARSSKQDTLAYLRVVERFGHLKLKAEEISYIKAQTEFINLKATKEGLTMGRGEQVMNDHDTLLLNDAIRTYNMQNKEPEPIKKLEELV